MGAGASSLAGVHVVVVGGGFGAKNAAQALHAKGARVTLVCPAERFYDCFGGVRAVAVEKFEDALLVPYSRIFSAPPAGGGWKPETWRLVAGAVRGLVFLNFARRLADTADKLAARGMAVGTLSGELSKEQRAAVLTAFRSGRLRALLVTDLAARGLDVRRAPRPGPAAASCGRPGLPP